MHTHNVNLLLSTLYSKNAAAQFIVEHQLLTHLSPWVTESLGWLLLLVTMGQHHTSLLTGEQISIQNSKYNFY